MSGTLFPLTLRLPPRWPFWTAFKDRTFSPLLQRCLTVIFSTLIVVFEINFLFRHLNIMSDDDDDDDDDDDTGLLYSKIGRT